MTDDFWHAVKVENKVKEFIKAWDVWDGDSPGFSKERSEVFRLVQELRQMVSEGYRGD